MIPYAELHVHSAYSFLDGASMPSELVDRAVELELSALALTDHDGLPGVVQLASAARRHGLPTVIGSEITVGGMPRTGQKDPDGEHLIVLARDADGYRALSRTIGEAMLASGKRGVRTTASSPWLRARRTGKSLPGAARVAYAARSKGKGCGRWTVPANTSTHSCPSSAPSPWRWRSRTISNPMTESAIGTWWS